tara:strand:- start:804 stop:2183 length:1380 start_codon:yes stop_codon:yes gene_type:complete
MKNLLVIGPVILVALISLAPFVFPLLSELDTSTPLSSMMFSEEESYPNDIIDKLLNSTKNTSSIAIVGSSGNLIGTGSGREIDACDVVVRVNGAPIRGFENDVGYRTDYRVAFYGGYEDAIFRNVDSPNISDILVTVISGTHASGNLLSKKPPNLVVVTNFWSRMLKSNTLGSRGWPSTGFQALALFVSISPPNTVQTWGFGSSKCVHYYDCQGNSSEYTSSVDEERQAKDGGIHPFASELYMRHIWNQANIIKTHEDIVNTSAWLPSSMQYIHILYILSFISVFFVVTTLLLLMRHTLISYFKRIKPTYEHIPIFSVIILMTLIPFLITSTLTENHNYRYIPFTVILSTELFKLVISIICLCFSKNSLKTPQLRDVLSFSFPTILYMINNYIAFVVLKHFDEGTFQIMSSLKIIFTALLFWIVLQRPVTHLQVIGIILLTVASSILGIQNSDGVGNII